MPGDEPRGNGPCAKRGSKPRRDGRAEWDSDPHVSLSCGFRIAFGNQTIFPARLKVGRRRDSRLCVPASRQVCPYRVQSSPWERPSAALSRATCIHSKQFFAMLSTAFFLTRVLGASADFSPEKRAAGRFVFIDCQGLSQTHIIFPAAFSHGRRRPTRSEAPRAFCRTGDFPSKVTARRDAAAGNRRSLRLRRRL